MRSPIENSPKRLRLLGTIAARWATLDTLLVGTAAAVVPYRIAEAIMLSSSSQKLRIDQLRSMIAASQLSAEDKAGIARAFDKILDLWAQRNEMLHSPAVATDAEYNKPTTRYYARVVRPANKRPRKNIELTTDFMKAHADKLSAVGNELYAIVFRDLVEASDAARKRARQKAYRERRAQQPRRKTTQT